MLPDIHWVGGNPWDGTHANPYGWAAWNGRKAVLSLRNPAASQQALHTTLRKALDIPAYVSGSITLTASFSQPSLHGLACGVPIDIDTPLTITLPPLSLFVFTGTQHS